MTTTIPTQEQRSYSPEEYLALEEVAKDKSEYRQGKILAMTGGTTNHNRIAGNLYIAISLGLRGSAHHIFIGDVRLWITEQQFYTYPDVMVIADKPEYFNNRQDTVTNPQIIIEVLSKSTKAYDRGEKFDFYRSIPTFQEYLLIEQNLIHIEQFSKTANKKWSWREYDREDNAITLNTIPLEIPLVDIYQQVDFAETESANS